MSTTSPLTNDDGGNNVVKNGGNDGHFVFNGDKVMLPATDNGKIKNNNVKVSFAATSDINENPAGQFEVTITDSTDSGDAYISEKYPTIPSDLEESPTFDGDEEVRSSEFFALQGRHGSLALRGSLYIPQTTGIEVEADETKLTPFSLCCVLVNLISIGYILIPSAFAEGGVLLGPICLILVSLQSFITGTYVLEACARAEALEQFGTSKFARLSLNTRRGRLHAYSMCIRARKFELSELCRIFMGRRVRNFFTLTTAGDLYGISWTLAAVFASAMAENFPIGDKLSADSHYKIYVLLFMAFTVPISCLQFSEQLFLQMVFLAGRTIMYLLMIATVVAAYIADNPHFGTGNQSSSPPPLANFSNFLLVFQLCIFSTGFQFSLPGLTAESSQKKQMIPVTQIAVSYIYATNLILGLVVAFFFGSNTNQSNNLNWADYHGGSWDGIGDLRSERSWWSKIISGYVVLYAAIDGLAVFPLIAVSLGDILMGAVYEEKVHEIQSDWKRRTLFRICASVPQCLGAVFVNDLGIIAKFAGIFTLCSYTLCPSLLTIFSRRKLQKYELPVVTYFKTPFSSEYCAMFLVGFSSILAMAVIIETMIGLL